ncbi:aminomethyl-transferring glycine dehydrogenase [Meiothermus rufus]|uniref:aminomethyl-transferring glycine dehydrogenase n=1 Tax=Meiothermus rufus TaxID=604332 RepID=UPI00042A57FC|nr:aminomethyl-transferring glycine dehydrogenase [Meiothermus rufus]
MSSEKPLTQDFAPRHIGPSPQERQAMLEAVGVPTLEALIEETLPASIRQSEPLSIGPGLSEAEVLEHLRALAAENQVYTSLIGQGYYGTFLPPVIQRNILENPAWYTAYTPYQPEISQGRLEALLNFQTMVADLTGLPVANASLLDEATAAAEGMAVAQRGCKAPRTRFFADRHLHPQTLAVLQTRAEPLGWEVVVGDPEASLEVEGLFGAIFQYPDTLGQIRDLRGPIQRVKAAGGLVVVAADLLALTLLTPPGELGADIAVGSTQRFGVPMGYGGPHAGYIAVREELKRALPGRLVGVSLDARGNRAYRLALQTREQHIRREKATSNICTAQVLPAVIASMYAVYHGPQGLRAIAWEIHRKTSVLAQGLARLGYAPLNPHFFDTLTVPTGSKTEAILAAARARHINLRKVDEGHIGIALDETTTPQVVEAVWAAFGGAMAFAEFTPQAHLPTALRRTSSYLTHPVFNRYHTETELLRYLRRLADRDLALDRAMIPLGSCTMKLNPTAAMLPITWPEFAQLHPFAPLEQAQGYQKLFVQLSRYLAEITGYDAVSLQPNSGAQGEYAGLLAIRAYHRARGEAQRNVCLIPSSAHGTNPASAQMAGMEVVVVACDARGYVDLADLEAKARQYADRLAAVMVTYPSTHGVFEEEIGTLCEIVHRYGGQVYLDGANLNAQVGLAKPGQYGADVSHLNLHKTFAIPHGGGGPGMGPIGVKKHLAPFLPGHPFLDGGTAPVGPVSAAPFGSASILPISYAYIRLLGSEGLRQASQVAILNANYIACRLEPHFPVLYKNARGRVAHECIIDLRPFKAIGITAEDVAKRLIDFGFHAPTMSFPVPGTLMIEPTESESKAELDRFIAAMIAIREEIAQIERGQLKAEESPLHHAPHTVLDLADENWPRKYTRAQGCFPAGQSPLDKYWSPVNRVDNVYGDRHLVCTCPPLEEYAQAAD